MIEHKYNSKNYENSLDIKTYLDILYSTDILSNDCIKKFNTNDFIQTDKPFQKYSKLNEYKDCTGIYIFLNADCIPVYVGVGGEKNGKQDLMKRLTQHFPASSHLAKNIKETEKVLGIDTSDKTPKEIMLKYAPELLIVNIGALSDEDSCRKSNNLEKALISLWNCRYNR